MNKIIIYGLKEEGPTLTRLRLVKSLYDDTISLIAVDHKGVRLPQGSILTIGAQGLTLSPMISQDLGIAVDSKSTIHVTN